MRELDLATVPLAGANLIEASAGTGKTYTIAGLYLRFLLEQGCTVDQILVVTYTVAATEELKDRIRKRIREALDCFTGRDEPADDLTLSLTGSTDPDTARGILTRALRDFDQAAIFTIHGFCQRVLGENAFESSVPFDWEFITDQQPLVREIVDDYWRRHFLDCSPTLAAHLQSASFSPASLAGLAGRSLNFPLLRIEPQAPPPDTADDEARFLAAHRAAAAIWRESGDRVNNILRHDKGLKRNIYTTSGVEKLLLALEKGFATSFPDPALFSDMGKLTGQAVATNTKQSMTPPEHPLFQAMTPLVEAAATLEEAYARLLIFHKAEFIGVCQRELNRRKSEKGLLSFDDLLLQLHQAMHSTGGARLTAAVRRKYKIALIDEFQDTDPLQYAIFARLFDAAGHVLFLIGDPKQAIYSFRGADLFAYMQAARDIPKDNTYTLKTNYRSAPGLVDSVNTLFARRDNPFVFPEITYQKVDPAPNAKDRARKTPLDAGIEIWLLEHGEFETTKRPISRQTAADAIARAVAGEISRIIDPAAAGAVSPGDIAVLTRTHRQARLVRDQLSTLRIPSVLYNSGNLFDTEEAAEMLRLMEAVLAFGDPARLRSGLATSIMGLTAADIDALERDDHALDAWIERFAAYHRAWAASGFLSCFTALMHGEEIRAGLLGLDQGERKLTNVLHLMEVLHQQETGSHAGMETLVSWLAGRIDPSSPRSDEHMLRLESDATAVKIITVHKSKGLEFPIVFCPFFHESSEPDREGLYFHDPDQNNALCLHLAPDAATHVPLAANEILAENVRLLYVALTRARDRCFLCWGRINKAETAAAAYLLHGGPQGADGAGAALSVPDRIRSMDPSELEREVRLLALESPHISVTPLLDTRPRSYAPPGERHPELACRTVSRRIADDWKISSFTRLTRGRTKEEFPAFDEMSEPAQAVDEKELTGMFAFPRGARPGILLHDILERVDFTAVDDPATDAVVRERLHFHGFDPDWRETLLHMLRKVVTVPLDGNRLRLCDVPTGHRLNELEFLFPLRPITPESLAALFAPLGEAGNGTLPATYTLAFDPHRGFLKGFIDLVFAHEERFYLIDWKSNFLGGSVRDYSPERLSQAMTADGYRLQYHLYCLALDAYLKTRLPGYDYERHFGGVFYLFLRGVDPASGPDYGVFRDRPDKSLIERLDQGLMARTADAQKEPA